MIDRLKRLGRSRTADAPTPKNDPPAQRPRRPPSKTILHIGTMKSGTTFLQDMLDHNRSAMTSAGVRYLGRGTRAVWDVLELRSDQSEHTGAWDKLIGTATSAREPVRLLSMEVLSTADDAQARDVVSSFGGGPVEVILTVRDLVRVMPSAWQNAIKHGGRPSFEEFVDAVMDPTDEKPSGARFWRQHDVPGIAARWAELVGPENVHVVTLPPAGADPAILWQRFCSVLGIDATQYPAGPAQAGNTSLSYSDAELLRRINKRIGTDLGKAGYNKYVRTFLAHDIMRGSPDDDEGQAPDTPVLSGDEYRWAIQRSEEITAALLETGVHVVGDLAELVPTPRTSPDEPRPGPRVEYPDTAVRAMATLLRKLTELDDDTTAGRRVSTNDQNRRRNARRRRNGRQNAVTRGARQDAS